MLIALNSTIFTKMDLYKQAGHVHALEKLGFLASNQEITTIKELISKDPGLAVGFAIGAGLALKGIFGKDKPTAHGPINLEPNPLRFRSPY